MSVNCVNREFLQYTYTGIKHLTFKGCFQCLILDQKIFIYVYTYTYIFTLDYIALRNNDHYRQEQDINSRTLIIF